jgi:hypothetical protein
MAEQEDVNADSSSALEGAIASSPEALDEQTQDTQTPAKEGDSQEQSEQQAEEPRVPYSRLKEVVDEKNWYRQQLEQRLAQQSQQQPQQPTTPQELGNTPEEREFWNMQRKIAREEAEKTFRQITPVIDAGRMELAQMKVQQFRNSHPDVKPNSPEEIAIAERISSGYLPEDAYKVVMWDRKVAQVEKQVNTNNKVKIEAKKQANVEQRSIPQGAGSPTTKNESQRQRIERLAKELEL